MPANKPNPGSPEALQQGCTCDQSDNHYGKGYMNDPDRFVVNGHCPVHGQKAKWNMQAEPKTFRANEDD